MSIATKVLKNTLSNWAGMLINTVILLLLTPYLLRHLGDERFGIYQIVVPVVQYLVLLELGLRGSIARFASKHIAAKDTQSLNSVISTTFFICLFVGLITIVISFALALVAPYFFNIPEIYHQQVLYLFLAVGFNIVASFLSYSFSGIIIGHNRYELLNLQLIVNNLTRAFLVIYFFSVGWVSLNSWALSIVLSSLIGLIYVAGAAFHLQRRLSISPRYIKIVTLKELLGFSVWNMLVQLGGFLILYANPLIIGRYIGAEAVPYYAIPFMLITRLHGIVMGMTTTFIPIASSTLVSGDIELMRRLLRKGTYMASMIVFPLGGVLLMMCKDLFRVWLPAGYESSWIIYAILMIAFFGIISQNTISHVLLGGGNIRGMAIVHLSSSITAVVLSIIFVGYMGLGIVGAAVALAIPKFFDSLFKPWYASRQVRLNLWCYITDSYSRPVLCSLPSVAVGALLVYWLPPSNIVYWFLEFFVAMLPYAVFALMGVLDWPMREKIISMLYDIVLRQTVQ